MDARALAAPPVVTRGPRDRKLSIECVDARRLGAIVDAWADLFKRALEPNIFLDPAFALPLLRHDSAGRQLCFLLIWRDGDANSLGDLLGLVPLELGRGSGMARVFAHVQTSCGTPLVDGVHAAEVFAAVMTWLGARRRRGAALALAGIVKDGPFHAELSRFCVGSSRRVVLLDEYARAVLRREDDGGGRIASFASAKRRQRHGRQARRLSQVGMRTYVVARTPPEVASATERFLALENAGWKGTRGTALLADPMLAAFTRTMTCSMAQAGKCRIDSIEIDGRPIAIGIILTYLDRAHFWKIAFDESFAAYSPGVQLALEVTRTQLADPSVTITDSCAPADHPMISKLWPDRMAVADLVVAVAPARSWRFTSALRVERVRRAVRARAKEMWIGARRLLGN